jgi:hypothetical protein
MEPAAIMAELFAENRRSISMGSSPLTLISPLNDKVESPRARSLDVIVLKTVMFRSKASGMCHSQFRTSMFPSDRDSYAGSPLPGSS